MIALAKETELIDKVSSSFWTLCSIPPMRTWLDLIQFPCHRSSQSRCVDPVLPSCLSPFVLPARLLSNEAAVRPLKRVLSFWSESLARSTPSEIRFRPTLLTTAVRNLREACWRHEPSSASCPAGRQARGSSDRPPLALPPQPRTRIHLPGRNSARGRMRPG